MEQGTLYVDLDGTVLHSETEEPLPFAVEFINKQFDEGFMIVLTTYREITGLLLIVFQKQKLKNFSKL